MVKRGVMAFNMPESELLILLPAQENNMLGNRLPSNPEMKTHPHISFGILLRLTQKMGMKARKA